MLPRHQTKRKVDMHIFNPKPHHEFICMFSSSRHMREETDKCLRFDTQENEFFIIEQTEYVSGPSVSVSHTKRSISMDEARSIVSSDSEWLSRANQYFQEN